MDQNIGNITASVNGFITARRGAEERSFYRSMALRSVLSRIERRLTAVGMTASGASKKAGKPDAIRNMQRAVRDGTRFGVSTATLEALSPILKTTAAWLQSGVGVEDIDSEERTIPVWGRAGAGGIVNNFHESSGPIGAIDAPEDVTENTAAVEIEGESLGRLFDKWFAIYDEIRHPPTENLIGELCIVEVEDSRVYIKRLKKGRGKTFVLESNYESPIENVRVKWAARVKRIVPR